MTTGNPLADAEKSLTIAHLAYNGIGTALKSAADSGALRGANAATAKSWYDKAGDSLKAADAADVAANAPNINAAIAAATDAITQANAIIAPKGPSR
jgi:hypothetical protein